MRKSENPTNWHRGVGGIAPRYNTRPEIRWGFFFFHTLQLPPNQFYLSTPERGHFGNPNLHHKPEGYGL